MTMFISKVRRSENIVPIRILKFNKEKYNKSRFCENLNQNPWFFIYREQTASNMLLKFKQVFTDVLIIHALLETKFARNKSPLQLFKKVMNSIDESLRLKKETALRNFQSS